MKTKEIVGGAIGFVAGVVANLNPVIIALLILISVDVATGFLAAYVRKEITSDATFQGGAKKAIILLVVLSGKWISGFVHVGVDLGAALAAYYAVHEAVSILENAARAGVPLPSGLVEALAKAKATADKM
jgi:toxin secretion/phage lysis holin